MRALTHPLRLALIELLRMDGSLNATQAAERLGESQASCSFHLRQLARFGFVEEVPNVRGRARPWRMTALAMRFANVHDDPESAVAWSALERLLRGRQIRRYRRWLETRTRYPRDWREAAYVNQQVAWLTPEELHAVTARIDELVAGLYRERRADPGARPPEALPVEILSLAYPISANPAED